jgi:uncharacterized membrane protein
MSRQINSGDNYRERLLKLIPSELPGTYMAANAALTSMDPSTRSTVLSWVVFGICLAVTPLWLWFGQGFRKVLQIVLTGIAFVIWVMTMSGPFTTIPGYKPFIGTVFLILFSGLIAPLFGMIVARQTR